MRTTKYISLILVFWLLLPAVVTSQIVWEQIPTPDGIPISSFEIGNEDEIYIGTGSGVYKSSDLGQSWDSIGLSNARAMEFNLNQNLIAIAHGSTYIYSDDFVWEFLNDQGLSTMRTVYDKMFGGSYDGIFRSINNANTWEQTYNSISGGEFFSDFAAPNSDTIYAGATDYLGGYGVYRSTNEGVDWSTLGLVDFFVNSMGVDNSGNIYAGAFGHYYTGQGGLYRYDNQNNIWDTLMYFPYITSIEVSNEDIIYLGYRFSGSQDGGGVMHSNDYGESWIIDTTGLFNSGINELIFDNSNFLYALGGYPLQNLYKSSLPVTVNEQTSDEYMAESYCFPNPLTTSTTFSFRITNAGNYNLSVFNQSGKLIRETELGYLTKGNHSKNVNMSDFSSGIYFYSLQQNGITIATNKMVIY